MPRSSQICRAHVVKTLRAAHAEWDASGEMMPGSSRPMGSSARWVMTERHT
jgi:hypothetical protein